MLHIHKYLKRFFEWDYALTFWILILIFVVPLFPSKHIPTLYPFVFSMVYILAAMTCITRSKRMLYAAIGLFVLEMFSGILNMVFLNFITNVFAIVFFVSIVVIFVIRIAKSRDVTLKVILEAMNGYMLLALVFTAFTNIIMKADSSAFYYSLGNIEDFIAADKLYFSLVSMTTLGYGDILPVSSAAKSLATLMAVTGQFYIAILVAMLVGKYIAQQQPSQ